MKLICPTCRGTLRPRDEAELVCERDASHSFALLYLRPVTEPEPDVPKLKPLGSGKAPAPPPLPARAAFSRPAVPARETQTSESALPCVKHRNVASTRYCSLCEVPICDTCTFELPSQYMICPDCASNPPRPTLSKGRLPMAVGSMALAAVTLVGFFIASMLTNSMEVPELVFTVLLLASEGGLALSMCAMDRREGNRWWIWAGVGANGLMVVIFLLATIVGLMMQG